MNLYKISQVMNGCYDCYTCAVVVAVDVEQAKNMHPSDGRIFNPDVERKIIYEFQKFYDSWTYPDYVTALFLGEAGPFYTKPEVICARYNGG